ncbi:DEAD/DEAH box helicase family protein [Chroococcidiopsis sp. CCMEE 29]|uniref:DEAD/DEAH box helicase n=1 Tax=Chroococcidiopsis sp. CCMEE 29 TaxID=155894 RepID=UPI002020CF93|nr:DEAD/DEAH box helicase family protein [Chroococcidiopsis sp. CCMEE 29]
MSSTVDNYFLNYHQLVLARITSRQTKLYPHQIEALLAIYQKACRGEMDGSYRQAALILAGVGTGKTLMQALVPYVLAPWMQGKQALFLSDNCTLRARFLKDFPTDAKHRPLYEQWLLYSLGVLPPGVPPPQIVELDASDFSSYAFAMQQADLLVGNRQFVVNLVQRGDIEPTLIGVLVCDEAHFSAAASYRTITSYFSASLLCYFTGSKFRSDGQPLPHIRYNEVEELDELGRNRIGYAPVADYEFTLQQAWQLHPSPIKKLMYKEATSTAFLVEEEGTEVEYAPDEFLLKAQTDKQWFRQILLADSFSLPVLEMAVQILLVKRSATGQPHAMLVRALNIPHTHRVAKLLEDNFPLLEGKVLVIHSEHEQYDLAGRASALIERFYAGEYWVVVHCGMLGVGFDHKWVSVSCCLCVLKSMSPAEQEWGRALRKVPGAAASQFPQLNHPNWAVVVTHSALGLRELFEKFQQGVTSDAIKDAPREKPVRPILTAAYEAGETVLKLSNTGSVKPGDVLELRVPVAVPVEQMPKFSLVEELRSTGDLSVTSADDALTVSSNGSAELETDNSKTELSRLPPLPIAEQQTTMPWQQEAEAIAQRLAEIRSYRTCQIQVEAVLDNQRVQITPTWSDIPSGVEITKSRVNFELPTATFLDHIGLDWQVLVGEELISYSDYKKRMVLQQRGMNLDKDGEIVVSGVRLKDTMPAAAYALFLKGLETELATVEVEIAHSDRVVRPDKAKLEMQSRYGAQVRSLINELFMQRSLVRDGASGRSLLERPVKLLAAASARVQEKGHEPDFANNSALIHSAVFGFVKQQTGRGWSEHTCEQQYQEAVKTARLFLLRLREQLQWRPQR